MKVSIAMATYNGAKFLSEQLESFIVQKRQPDELVITDDCSTDNTLEIINEFAKNAPFQVICSRNKKNLGYAGNFNEALKRTTGDLVFLSDQDDVWFPEKISIMLKFASDNPQAMVLMNDAEFAEHDLSPAGVTKLEQIRATGYDEKYFVMGCCALIRREYLEWCLPIKKDIPHDVWLVGIAQLLNSRVINTKVLQFYRQHGQNESKKIFNTTKKINTYNKLLIIAKRKIDKLLEINIRGDKAKGENKKSRYTEMVKHLKHNAPKKYTDQIQNLLNRENRKAEFIEIRKNIRKENILKRLDKTCQLMFSKSDNSMPYSFRNFLRDIIG